MAIAGVPRLLLAFPLNGLEFSALAMFALLLHLSWLDQGMHGGEIGGCLVDV